MIAVSASETFEFFMKNIYKGLIVTGILCLLYIVATVCYDNGLSNASELVRIEMENIKFGLDQFQIYHGRYPTQSEGIEVLYNGSPVFIEGSSALPTGFQVHYKAPSNGHYQLQITVIKE